MPKPCECIKKFLYIRCLLSRMNGIRCSNLSRSFVSLKNVKQSILSRIYVCNSCQYRLCCWSDESTINTSMFYILYYRVKQGSYSLIHQFQKFLHYSPTLSWPPLVSMVPVLSKFFKNCTKSLYTWLPLLNHRWMHVIVFHPLFLFDLVEDFIWSRWVKLANHFCAFSFSWSANCCIQFTSIFKKFLLVQFILTSVMAVIDIFRYPKPSKCFVVGDLMIDS